MKWICVFLLALAANLQAQELPDLNSVPTDLTIPDVSTGDPAPGKRVSQTTAGWENTPVHHLLYLPTDWKPNAA